MICVDVSVGINFSAKAGAGTLKFDLTESVGRGRGLDASDFAKVVFGKTFGGILTFTTPVLGKVWINGFVGVEEDFATSFRFAFKILLSRTDVAISSVGVASGLGDEKISFILLNNVSQIKI